MGSFWITFEAKASPKKSEVTPETIRKAKLRFTPQRRFKQMLKTLQFYKK